MKIVSKQFASLRLPVKMKQQIEAMAKSERRSMSQMLLILVEEALASRGNSQQSKAAD